MTEMKMFRRDALAMLSLVFAGAGCASGREGGDGDPLQRLAHHFGRRVVAEPDAKMLHASHAPSVPLPRDYLRFLATFGPCTFQDGRFLLSVADLTSATDPTTLDLFAVLYDRDYRVGVQTLPGFRGIPGVIPWAYDDQGTTLYWVAQTRNPDEWTVAMSGTTNDLVLVQESTVQLLSTSLFDEIPYYEPGNRFDLETLTVTRH